MGTNTSPLAGKPAQPAQLVDIDKLLAVEHEGIEGVILGRSLYEGTLDFAAALERTGVV